MSATPDEHRPGLHGILLIDKEPGWTSHDVVAKARRITGQRKIGHTGTLDPAATGLIVLCLGDATRLVEYMTGHAKRYEGVITLGARTTTDDAEGDVMERRDIPPRESVDLTALEARFRGIIRQRPPSFSAISVGGERAYAAARRGNALDVPEREVTVHAIGLTWAGEDRLRVALHCGAGTYVRSIARDIGEIIGCGAHLSALRRNAAGEFRAEQAVSLARLEAIVAGGDLAEMLIPPDEGITDCEAAIVLETTAAALRNGIRVTAAGGAARASDVSRIYAADGEFVGVGRVSEAGELRPLKVLQGR